MNILGRQITLSRQDLAKQTVPKATGQEQGTAGGVTTSYFGIETSLSKIKKPTIPQIMDMLDNDGTVTGLYNVITFPVLATDWHIEPDPSDTVTTQGTDGDSIDSHPQAEFVEKALRDPLHKGGMSTPFSLVLADIMLGVAQGYRCFEIVYKVNKEGSRGG